MNISENLIHYLVNKYWEIRTSNKKDLFDLHKTINITDITGVFQVNHVQVAIGKYNGENIIYILGSNEFTDWLYNFTFPFSRTPYKTTNKKIKMHMGFYKSYNKIRNEIHKRVSEMKSVIFMGHSLGGSIATIASLDVQYNFPNKDVGCVTTGSPRVGNKALTDSYNKRIPNTKRIVYKNDFITRIPFKWMGYKHVSGLQQLKKKGFFCSINDHLYPKGYLKEL